MAFQTIQQGHDVGPVANAPSTSPQIPGSTMIDHELCSSQELEIEVHSFTDKELGIAPGLTAEFMWRKTRDINNKPISGSASPWTSLARDFPTITNVMKPVPYKFVQAFSMYVLLASHSPHHGCTYLTKVSFFDAAGMNIGSTASKSIYFT